MVAGTTGESATLDDAEKADMFRTVVRAVAGRVPVIANTGTYDTRHSVELTRTAAAVRRDAVLVVTPYYNKPPERGLLAHFRAVAAATDLPVIVYNIPGRCVVNLSPEALAQLAEVPNIVAVKQANPDLSQTRRLRELSDLAVYAGNDDMLLDVLTMGGQGRHLRGQPPGGAAAGRHGAPGARRRCRRCDRRRRTSCAASTGRCSSRSNPIPVKQALRLLGFDCGGLRLPLVEATDEESQAVATELDEARPAALTTR